ncbi:hypothetical protein AVW09_07535 [Microbacterium sp. T32]|nr:hypothetical protein AVW09_07535 [Microbacterium sp. T32]
MVTEFNPWYYEGLSALQTGFFREISSSVPSGRSWRKFRNRMADLGDAIAPFGSLGGLVGVDASGVIGGVSSLVRGASSVETVKGQVEAELQKANRPILVIIDDVDRLDPSELLMLFKLIRLAGRLRNVYYLLAYDEDTLIDALGRTGLIGDDSPRRAIDYLEKIVQIRLDVPPLRAEQISSWVDEEVQTLAARHDVEQTSEFEARFSRAYFGHLRHRLVTPRAIKRYFAQVDAFLGQVRGEVDFVDFLIISWLRASEPLVYRGLIQHRSRLVGEFDWTLLGSLDRKRDVQADHDFWRRFFAHARVDEARVDGVADLLGLLFPRFSHEWSDSLHSFSGPKAVAGRISNADYFDRFFAVGVPAEDLSDLLVEAASGQILDGRSGAERARLEDAWPERATLIMTKLERGWRQDEPRILAGLTWLATQFPRLPERYDLADPRKQAQWFGRDIYVNLSDQDALTFLSALRPDPQVLQFCSFLVESAIRKREEESRLVEGLPLPTEIWLAESIERVFIGEGATNPLDYSDDVWPLFWTWARIDAAAVNRWAAGHLDAGHWPSLDLVARMVTTAIPLGVPNPVPRLSDLDLELVDRVVGLERVDSDVSGQIGGIPKSLPRDAPATPENRRNYVLDVFHARNRPSNDR